MLQLRLLYGLVDVLTVWEPPCHLDVSLGEEAHLMRLPLQRKEIDRPLQHGLHLLVRLDLQILGHPVVGHLDCETVVHGISPSSGAERPARTFSTWRPCDTTQPVAATI